MILLGGCIGGVQDTVENGGGENNAVISFESPLGRKAGMNKCRCINNFF